MYQIGDVDFFNVHGEKYTSKVLRHEIIEKAGLKADVVYWKITSSQYPDYEIRVSWFQDSDVNFPDSFILSFLPKRDETKEFAKWADNCFEEMNNMCKEILTWLTSIAPETTKPALEALDEYLEVVPTSFFAAETVWIPGTFVGVNVL